MESRSWRGERCRLVAGLHVVSAQPEEENFAGEDVGFGGKRCPPRGFERPTFNVAKPSSTEASISEQVFRLHDEDFARR